MKSRAIFYQVKDGKQKLSVVCKIAKEHFDRGEPLMIWVENDKGGEFIDRLLWSDPSCTFLPHEMSLDESRELLVITPLKENLNQAHSLLNLRGNPAPLEVFSTIHELDDQTNEVRAAISKEKYTFYRENGVRIPELMLK
ncbi:MAG: DNA polymerase III subunit chi [Simkaniaceae bacterium]|nr:DNA polymerase III subunit chi [Simkaniaceae bacterium]